MNPLLTVCVSHTYKGSAERVFDAWLTPVQAVRFLFATRTGNILRCEMTPHVGGGFVITDRRPDSDGEESLFEAEHHGRYIEIDRPRRLVFDFSVPPGLPTRVTIDIAAQEPGTCELTLTHEMDDSDEAREYEEFTRRGWTRMLETLEREFFPRRITL